MIYENRLIYTSCGPEFVNLNSIEDNSFTKCEQLNQNLSTVITNK